MSPKREARQWAVDAKHGFPERLTCCDHGIEGGAHCEDCEAEVMEMIEASAEGTAAQPKGAA